MAAPILSAQPIVFDFRDGGATDVLGFSAEQLHAIDPHLVNLDAEGRPDSIRVQAFLAHVLVVLQRHEQRIAALETRVGVDRC